jgi:tight adherence protein B
MELERLIHIIAMAAVFGLVFSVWCICIVLWFGQYLQRVRSVQKKLGITGEKATESETLRLWRESEKGAGSDILPDKLTWEERLEELRRAAGWHAPVLTVILGVVGLAVFGFVIAYLVKGVIIGLGVSAAILIIFWSYTKKRISKYSALFERQLVDALGIAARALRAGHPLLGSFQLIAEEIDEPLADVFYRICQEQMLGLDLKDSIKKVARGAFNSELKFFAISVAIQLQSGGNLADLMDSLATIMRARIRLNRRVRVMTAQTQFSKMTLIALPIVMFFWLNLVNPEYMEPLYTTTIGKYMLGGMACSLLFGSWVMNRMTVLRF